MSEKLTVAQQHEIQEQEKHAKRGLRFTRILLVISLINAALYGLIAYRYNTPLLYAVVASILIYDVILYFSDHWIRNGRVYRGIQSALLGSMLVAVTAGFVIEGLGILLGLGLILVLSLLSAILLPQSLTMRMIAISFGAAFIIVASDVLVSYERVAIPAIEAVVPVIAIILVVLFAIFVFRNFKEYSLQAKLIIATLSLAIVAIVSVTVVVSVTTRQALTTQVGNNLNSLAETQALALGEVLFQQLALLESIGLNKSVTTALFAKSAGYSDDEAEIQRRIQEINDLWLVADSTNPLVLSVVNNSTSEELLNFQDAFAEHENLLLTDQYGALVAATYVPEKYYFGDEEWWQETYRDGFGIAYISEPIEREGEQPILRIAVPVRNEDTLGRVNTAGILQAEYQLDALVDVLTEANVGETGFVEFHFADSERELDVGGNLFNPIYEIAEVEEGEGEFVLALKSSEELFTTGEYEEIESLVSVARVNTLSHSPRIDALDWNLIVIQPQEEAFTPINAQLQTNLLLGLVIVVIAGGLAAIVSRILSRPILQLTETATAVAAGDYTARAEVDTGDEIGTLAETFNLMTEQLQIAIEGLETRVEERTRALTASTEVSRSLSTILDPDELVSEVVTQIQTAFNYYHVQIYIFDDRKENLVMMGGSGEAGRVMLAREHAIPAGKGLVGQSAAMNTPVLIPDVTQSEDWLPSPLLPDTQAEVVVPIASGQNVFGVLDVQHDIRDGLSSEDVDLLQAIANQIAVALQNARLYAGTQAQAQQEAVVNAIGQQIQQATTMEHVLQIAAQELGRSLDVERVTVQIHREQPENGRNGNI